MRKLLALMLFVLPFAAMAQTAPNLLGPWTIGLLDGHVVDENGVRQSFPYAELRVDVSSVQQMEGGWTFFSGSVAGYSNSSITIFHNAATPEYIEVSMYFSPPTLGGVGSPYFYQLRLQMFLSPGGDYLYGAMTASLYDSLRGPEGTATVVVLYHSDVVMLRPGGKG